MKSIKISAAILMLPILFSFGVMASDGLPYENYTYLERDGSAAQAPQAYVPEKVLYGAGLGIGNFNQPADIHYDKAGNIYILDSGNSRIVVLSGEYRVLRVFGGFARDAKNDTFENARGIFVDDEYIYIADTAKERVVILNKENGALIKIITAPTDAILGEDFIFKPMRLTVDSERLLYIVGEGVFEGMINLDWNGNFIGYFGSNRVVASAWDVFWKRFSTKKQRKSMEQFIPQDHSSIDMDEEGFFLCTTFTSKSNKMVKRLNPGNDDVIRSFSKTPLAGDPFSYGKGSLKGNSSFVDIASGANGMYVCLDSLRGRIFCYNNDGYLMYTFGAISPQVGGFSQPASLAWLANGTIAVVDSSRGSVTFFRPTEYAAAIHEGIAALAEYDYEKSYEQWQKVLSLNSRFEPAYSETGKIYLNNGEYQKAMRAFKAANNKAFYSKAVGEYRTEWIYENIAAILVSAAVLIAAAAALRICFVRRRKKRRGK